MHFAARGVITCSSLFTEHSLFVIRYFVIHIRNSLFICGISLFIFGIRNSLFICVIYMRYSLFICVIRSFFFQITLFCAVTNYESNAIRCSVRNRKIYSKRMKSLPLLCSDCYVIIVSLTVLVFAINYNWLELLCNIHNNYRISSTAVK